MPASPAAIRCRRRTTPSRQGDRLGAGARAAALRLAEALDHTYLAGIHTNERWLGRILRSRVFLDLRHSVTLLDREAAAFSDPVAATPAALTLAALAARHARARAAQAPGT